METWIQYALIPIILMGLYYLLAKGSNQPLTAIEEGTYILKMDKILAILGWACLAMGIFCILVPIIYPDDTAYLAQFLSMGILGLLFCGAGYYIVTMEKNHCVVYDDTGFQVVGYFGKKKSGTWAAVEAVSYSSFTNLLTLKMENGEKIKCSQFLVGIIGFLEKAESETGLELKKIKGQILWK